MPVTTLLSLSSKSPFIVCSMKIEMDPVTISSLQLVQCLAMSEKGTGGMLKKEGASLPSSSVYSFLFLLRGYQQYVWGTPSGVCGVQLHPVASFPSNFRGTPMVRFPLSLAGISIATLDCQVRSPARR